MSKLNGMLVAVFVFQTVSCVSIGSDWEKTQQIGSIRAYQKFLIKHPKSRFSKKANREIEDRRWEQILKTNTIDSYKNYIDKYPSGQHAREALNNIETLEWEYVERVGSTKGVEDFINRYPKSERIAEAQTVLRQLGSEFLHAAFTGDQALVKQMLKNGIDVNFKNDGGVTALMLAAGKGYSQIVRTLIDHHANVNLQGRGGGTALIRAIVGKKPYRDVILLLLKNNADVNLELSTGDAALYLATGRRGADIVRWLLDAGADVSHKKDRGNSPLIKASILGSIDVVQELLDKNVDVNHQAPNGKTALYFAQMFKHWELANLLILSGAKKESGYPHQRTNDFVIARPVESNEITKEKNIINRAGVLTIKPNSTQLESVNPNCTDYIVWDDHAINYYRSKSKPKCVIHPGIKAIPIYENIRKERGLPPGSYKALHHKVKIRKKP